MPSQQDLREYKCPSCGGVMTPGHVTFETTDGLWMDWYEGAEMRKVGWFEWKPQDARLIETGWTGDGRRRAYRCSNCRFLGMHTDV